jgi:hypothetical protein
MAITYEWKIMSLSVKDEGPEYPNAVVVVKWRKTGTDENGKQAHFDGSTPFSAVGVLPENYIPFSQLTEEVVLGWVRNKIEARVTAGDITFCEDDMINEYIQVQIDLLKDPVRPEPLPWQQPT